MIKKYISILAIFFMTFSVYNPMIFHIDAKIFLGINVILGLASIYAARKDNTWLLRIISIGVAGILFILTKNGMFLYGVLGVCAVCTDSETSFTTIVKRILTIEIFFFVLILILDMIGMIHSRVYYTSGRSPRYDLGFGNPNITAMRMFVIAISAMYIYKKEKYNKFLFILATVVFPVVILYITFTRTAILTYGITYIAFSIYDKKFMKPLGKFKQLILLLPAFLLGLSTILAVYFGHNAFLNKVLSRRPSIWHDFFYKFHCTPTFFGRNNHIVAIMHQNNYPLDTSYISLLAIDGILVTILVLGGITLCMHLMLKKKLLVDVIFIAAFLIYGFTETIMTNPRRNIALYLVFGYLLFYYSKKFRITKNFRFERVRD